MEHFIHDQVAGVISKLYHILFTMTGLSIFDWTPPPTKAFPEPKTSTMSTEDLKPLVFTAGTTNDQSQSSLFTILPGEIRDQIWAYALTDYEDKTAIYDDATCYKRPDYLAPRRTDTDLLRTCKRIYQEAWFLPWANAEHAFYLAWNSRKPLRTTSVPVMQKALDALVASHIEPTIEHVRVFAQLCNLENGSELSTILNMNSFHPKVITITIRHSDCWSWEYDARLRVGGDWVRVCRFPNSVKELRVAFESLERKKDHIDDIAAQAIEKWEFRKEDGTVMSAAGCEPEIMRWTGSSTWEGTRWLRDETRPNELDYYVSTITWRPGKMIETAEDGSPLSVKSLTLNGPDVPKLVVSVTNVQVELLQHLEISVDAPAEEVIAAINLYNGRDDDGEDEDTDSYWSGDEDMDEEEEEGEEDEEADDDMEEGENDEEQEGENGVDMRTVTFG